LLCQQVRHQLGHDRQQRHVRHPADLGGQFNNSGTINNSGGGTISNALTSTLDNSGTINNTSGGHINNLGTLTNEGIFNNTSGAHLTDAGTFNNTGIFSNSGAVTISSTGLFTTSSDYTQTAGHTTVNGTLTATSGARVDIEGGKLSGTGMINGDVLMKGIMSPGSGGVPGTFTVNGNYQQTAAGVFDEIIKSSSSNGVLDVTGLLALDPGSLLEITLQGGFDPVGDSFTILDYGSLSGEFGNGTSFMADGYNWTLTYGSNDAILTAVSGDPVSTPEPGTIALLAFGFLPLLGYAAKRRSPAGRNS
jgi:subtilase-type serine protease